MTARTLPWLKEILDDAETSNRLSKWEENFCNDMRGRLLERGERLALSNRQWEVLEQIEEKLYR